MIATIFSYSNENEGLSRELATCKELKEFIGFIGWQRIQRVVITDFRPLQIVKDGQKQLLEPDF